MKPDRKRKRTKPSHGMTQKQRYFETKEDNSELKVLLQITSKESEGYIRSLELGTPVTILQDDNIYCIEGKSKKHLGNSPKKVTVPQKQIKTNFEQ